MAYGVKYELDFSDIKGNKRSVQILKKDYTGDVNSIVGTDNPVIIKYTNDDDFYNPIIGSSCVLNIKTTDTISYDEFTDFDEREYKIRVNVGVEDPQADVNSPLWELADTNWEATNFNWAAATEFQVYWEGFLVSDTFTEAIQSKPFDISLRAIDNLGALDAYLVPDGNINTNADGTIKVAAGEQTNIDSAWFYIHKILSYTGLEFDIFVQNNIRRTVQGQVVNSNNNLFQDILINEFALFNGFAKKSAKEVLENLLRITNSRVYQANASWYVVSNSNYYDKSISGTQTGDIDGNLTQNNPVVTTDAVTNTSDTGVTLNGTITDDKGLAIVERGFYFGTNANILANPKVVSSDTSASFTSAQTSLITGQIYFIAAYAKNNTFIEGRGATIDYVPGATTVSQAQNLSPELTTLDCNPYNVTNTAMEIKGQVDDVGTSNVTEYGFYFGTNGNNYTSNTRYVIATGQNLSSAFGFTGNTNQAPFSLTLTAGTPHFITPFAKNSTGEGVGTTKTQYTWNAWQLRKQSDLSTQSVPYTSDTRGDNVFISTSSSNTDCYTIMVGQYLASLSGLPTISGACQDDTTEPTTTVAVTCKSIILYRSDTAFNLCCTTPTSREAFINGESFTDNTNTTKVYSDDTCTQLLPAQFLSEDLVNYREFNGSNLQNTASCPACETDVVTPDGFLVQRDNSQDTLRVDFNASFSVGDRVVLNVQTSDCFTILEEITTPDDLSAITVASLCSTQPPTPTQQDPTMTHFARYLKCNDDVIEILGNNKDEFPQFAKQTSSGDCYSFIDRTPNVQSDNSFNLGSFPTSRFTTDFVSCDDCLGISTTTQVPTTTTTTQPSIFYRIYQSLQSNCSADDTIIEVSNQTNSFPAVITDGIICYASLQDGGAGADGDVDNYIEFVDCATCQSYLSTTTTQAPTTTEAPCTAIQAAVTTIAQNACCGAKSITIYINSTSITSASVVYTNSACTTVLPAGNYIFVGDLFFWNGNTLSAATCPGCP
jgi:hypothetical protein